MESDGETETVSEAEKTEESVRFSRVSAVATEWMLDFLFISLCRRFKEGNFDEFSKTLSVVEDISQDKCLKGAAYKDKILICAFLARVMHGKELDVQFEESNSVMPLVSATKIWTELKHTVDNEMFQNITLLLLIQSVAVCLEQGSKSSASAVLKWLEDSHECPQNVRVRLKTVVTKMETYHPLLRSFSFDRLLESIQFYLDTYLKKNPSDYLLKAATAVVQSSQDMEDKVSQDSKSSSSPNKSVQENKKSKRKLLPSASSDFWTPDAIKMPSVSVKRLSRQELFQVTAAKSATTSMSNPDTSRVIKKRKKWTPRLDKRLENGVKCHGVGKWSRMLKDYDFEGRTGTMLKDRWRVLVNAHMQ